MCLGTVLLDEARARRRQGSVAIDNGRPDARVTGDMSNAVIGRLARRDLWKAIECELTDPTQRLVARLSFVSALSPREILAHHPEKFQSVFEVYRTKRNMIDRLRRSQALHELLD